MFGGLVSNAKFQCLGMSWGCCDNGREIIRSYGGQMTWSTIPLKNSHLFKIAELNIFFKRKLITGSAILNKQKTFSRMVDK